MRLASIFTDHMVFQAGKPIRIFGEGCGTVHVKILTEDEFGIKKELCSSEVISENTDWCLELPELEYGGPFQLEIGLNKKLIVLKDIYIGEVWIAAGQSNMEMPLYRAEGGLQEAEYLNNSFLHLFTVPRRCEKNTIQYGWHFEKRLAEDRSWEVCTCESALHFSALGYYVAKELHSKLNVHIGIISCNWGGTPIETFISREYFDECEALKIELNKYKKAVLDKSEAEHTADFMQYQREWELLCKEITYNEIEEAKVKGLRATSGWHGKSFPVIPYGPYSYTAPGVLFESMFARIIPFSVAGFLWYQGESNSSIGYGEKYAVFMKCMREKFQDMNLPFFAVELAPFANYWDCEKYQDKDDRYVSGDSWAFTREAQQQATVQQKNNYLVTSMDLGALYDIHPPYKAELGKRMAKKILKYQYGFEIKADQPIYDKVEFYGRQAILYFKHATGLYGTELSAVKMYMADERRILKRARLQLDNDKIIAECEELEAPILVRYGFDSYYAGCHIYNDAGLPLAPFRTDVN